MLNNYLFCRDNIPRHPNGTVLVWRSLNDLGPNLAVRCGSRDAGSEWVANNAGPLSVINLILLSLLVFFLQAHILCVRVTPQIIFSSRTIFTGRRLLSDHYSAPAPRRPQGLLSSVNGMDFLEKICKLAGNKRATLCICPLNTF